MYTSFLDPATVANVSDCRMAGAGNIASPCSTAANGKTFFYDGVCYTVSLTMLDKALVSCQISQC